HRVVLWIIVLAGMLVITLARRWLGGVVMTNDRVFFPYAGVLVFALVCQIVLLTFLAGANRRGHLLSPWLWRGSAVFDLLTAAALLIILAFFSPRGAVPALSAPALLLMPLVVLMSVLRLKPRMTLCIGLAGAGIHLLLAIRAIMVTDAL